MTRGFKCDHGHLYVMFDELLKLLLKGHYICNKDPLIKLHNNAN